MVIVAQLKPVILFDADSYERERPTKPSALDVEDVQYEMDRLLSKRLYRKKTTQYFVR